MANKLALYIIDSNEERFMRILDMSYYSDPYAITGQKLLVRAPGFTGYREIPVSVNFNVLITTVNLHQSSTPTSLVDGIYNIKYSISPNTDNWVEYKHLRTIHILHRYYTQLANLEIDCNLDKDKLEKLRLLNDIENYIKAAKIYVEYKNSEERGRMLYDYADKKLSLLELNKC